MRNAILFAVCFLLFVSCASPYKNLHRVKGDLTCITAFKPVFNSVVYKTKVDVTGRHINGQLTFKRMADSSVRILFANEIGFKFFDFEFSRDSGFMVHSILKAMDNKALIKTLRKDFEMILFMHTEPQHGYLLQNSLTNYYAFPQEKGTNYYITDSACSKLLRIEKSSKRKVVVEAVMENYSNGLPDTIGITHHNFNFTIGLKRSDNHATK